MKHIIAEAEAEKLKSKKISLEDQYKSAAKDEDRNREFREWDAIMVGNSLNASNDW